MATAAHFESNSESKAHNLYTILIVNTAIDISIINTVSLLGPSTASILKGIANFFFPHFLPKEKGRHEQVRRALCLHLLLASLTSLSVCLVTTYFHSREDKTIQDYVTFNSSHCALVILNLAVLAVFLCFSIVKRCSMKT